VKSGPMQIAAAGYWNYCSDLRLIVVVQGKFRTYHQLGMPVCWWIHDYSWGFGVRSHCR